YLLSFSRNSTAAGLVRSLGAPVSLPPVLRRSQLPRAQRLLNDARVIAGALATTTTTRVLAANLAALGARVVWTGDESSLAEFAPAAEAWAEPVVWRPLTQSSEATPQPELRAHGLVFDATGLQDASGLG